MKIVFNFRDSYIYVFDVYYVQAGREEGRKQQTQQIVSFGLKE